MKKFTLWTGIFILIGLGNLGNGLWMLVSPAGWYYYIPAGVPDFGPMNLHFIRDLGCMFAVWGIVMVWAGLIPRFRLPLVGTMTLWFSFHAMVHVFETATGFVGSEHWWVDFPLVYAPAIMNILILGFILLGRIETGGGKSLQDFA